ncbi:MAG: aryldialkylphosphatase [Dictyoglomus sp.]|nr:aryldialkylphosphatase [Dictyoglomus sp.]MDW8188290.1 aryldialkylphosphatase [Dictyoglomus sp.]
MIMTVRGEISPENLGKTLVHEHIAVDFSSAENQIPISKELREDIVNTMKPYLEEIKNLGFRTIFECTPRFVGRDVKTLKILSEAVGINIVTNTGFYAFGNYNHIPLTMRNFSPEEFAKIWIEEWKNGIEGTEIKPGFIKTSVNHGRLGDLDKKVIIASCMTHLETGLTIACHTGEKECALGVADIVEKEGVDPSAFIIVHADQIEDFDAHLELFNRGFILEYDGIGWKPIEYHVGLLDKAIKAGFINQILISHDAGWYTINEKGAKDKIRPYTDISLKLFPELYRKGYDESLEKILLIENPRRIFDIRIRKR